jgi:hypothetical protein
MKITEKQLKKLGFELQYLHDDTPPYEQWEKMKLLCGIGIMYIGSLMH